MIPLAKNIKRYFSLKELAIILVAVVVSVSVGVGVFVNLKKDVLINDNGKQYIAKTMKTTVKEVLLQNGINVTKDDYVSLPLDSELQKIKRNDIYIKRAVDVNVMIDGKQQKIMTYRDNIKDALVNSSLKLSQSDKIYGMNENEKVTKGMNVRVIRVKEEISKESIQVPYKVVTRENRHMDKGTQKVLRTGKEGIREKMYRVVFEDGKEVARELLKDATLLTPIDQLVELGTVLNHKTSRGDVVRYSEALDMRATAYTASYADTGKHPGHPEFGITFTGMRVKKGVIAVDPRVIPLGTRVYVEVAGSTPDYGYAIAADTGGAIKGDLIDLYFDSSKVVNNWGCKKVKVYILEN